MTPLLLMLLLRKWQKKIADNYQFLPNISYYNIRNAAWLFLIKNKVYSLPLDLNQIALKNNWFILNYEQHKHLINSLDKINRRATCDGWTIIFNSQIFICHKDLENEGRLRFTIAHEFGHIVLLHLTTLTNDEYEKEANMFAARILMPLCVLKEIGALTPEEIANICKTSLTAATYRAKRLHRKIQQNYFYKSKLEETIKKQFEDFIKRQRITNE